MMMAGFSVDQLWLLQSQDKPVLYLKVPAPIPGPRSLQCPCLEVPSHVIGSDPHSQPLLLTSA